MRLFIVRYRTTKFVVIRVYKIYFSVTLIIRIYYSFDGLLLVDFTKRFCTGDGGIPDNRVFGRDPTKYVFVVLLIS